MIGYGDMGSRLRGLALILILASPAFATDSVSNTACLPGDALDPWDTTEQRNDYVVDLTAFNTSWGTAFGIAPLVKSSKTSSDYFGSLMSAQAISRVQLFGQTLDGSFDYWNAPGYGVNTVQNDAPTTQIDLTGRLGNKFAVDFAEYSTTDNEANYNGTIAGLVQYEPSAPTRLYVSRIVAATNSCDNTSNLSGFGTGSIDPAGVLHLRADAYGTSAGCGLTALTADNVFRVDAANRNTTSLNVISNDYPGGQFDSAVTDWVVRNSATVHSTPGMIPGPIVGGAPLYIGVNFDGQYCRGTDFGAVTCDQTHWGTGVLSTRGNISYTSANCSQLSSTHGIAAIIGRDAATDDPSALGIFMNLWGLGASGNVTGTLALRLPAVITDPTTGATNIAGTNEFDHYHSQVAYRGGNGQIALGVDPAGNLLAAAQVDHPADGGTDWPVNYIAVARVDCTTGTQSWTMAGYSDGTEGTSGGGKPILDGPGGSIIGRMVGLDKVTTESTPFGPSVSAPMIDSAGNVWFFSAIELFGDPSDLTTGLLRAVYDPATFGYELELVFKLGDVFHGQNSDRDYMVTFVGIADSNSVASETMWSQNISESAHLGLDPATIEPADPRTLGGIVLAAEIVYDADQDGDFEQPCTGATGEQDQDYNVLLYIGSVAPGGSGNVPAVSEWGMIVMTLLVMAVGTVVMRGRKRQLI